MTDFREAIAAVRDRTVITQAMMVEVAEGAAQGTIPDYQLAAWLMAVRVNGLPREAIYWLTRAMADSGRASPLSHPGRVDKHSTGGVGDKTTLVVAPLVASLGVPVAKMSGRGLGHTGGTLDKLESIPGFRVDLSREEFAKLVAEVGVAVAAQSETLAPADGRLYALRDATGTVESLPLIASSIMSKKIAGGAPALVLDVKVGRGGFMPTRDAAEQLARLMLDIAQDAGLRTRVLLTNMDQPLGYAVGNAIEVNEAMDTLEGHGPPDFTELVERVAVAMLRMAGYSGDAEGAAHHALVEGRARERFLTWVAAQGGDASRLDHGARLALAPVSEVIRASREGWVAAVDPRRVAEAALILGAGRRLKSDAVNPGAAIRVGVKIGQPVQGGEVLAEFWGPDLSRVSEAQAILTTAVALSDKPPSPPLPTVLAEMGAD